MTKNTHITFALAILFAACALLRAQQPFQPDENAELDWVKEPTNCAVITSQRISFNQEQRRAIFEGNVVVVDGDLTLNADKMTVFMSASNKIETIRLETTKPDSRIHATQSNRVAMARQADYDAKAGKIVMTGNPILQQGRDILKGDTITFWTAHRRVVCEPNAVLVTYSEQNWRGEMEPKNDE